MPAGYKKNFTNHAVYIPNFTSADVAGVTFGGFEVDKYPCSQPSSVNAAGTGWYDVAHSGNAGVVPGISRPGVPVWDYITFPQAMIAAANKGKGWHLTSAFEWASLAFLAQKLSSNNTRSWPGGGNNNVDPPADAVTATEIALLDLHLHAENGAYHRALPGTGPKTWSHNHAANGVFDLNGLVWEWILLMMNTSGHAYVPANINVTYQGSPYGRGTISGSGGATPTLTCDGAGVNWLKAWTADEFNTDCWCYIAETAAFYQVVDTTATTIILANGATPGNITATFCIFKLVATDITSGMTSGHKILTLRDSDAALKAFAIPATASAAGSAAYGNDYYYYNNAALRAAVRGGSFGSAADAGVFALYLHNAPSDAGSSFGFRACKALE